MRISSNQILGFFLVIFGLYTFVTILITVFGLQTSPEQLYKSSIVNPKIIELDKSNINTLDLDSIDFISAFTQDGKPILFVRNSQNYPHLTKHSMTKEQILQYASGSKDAFADHCPSRRYTHNCKGPTYNGDDLVSPRVCECKPI